MWCFPLIWLQNFFSQESVFCQKSKSKKKKKEKVGWYCVITYFRGGISKPFCDGQDGQHFGVYNLHCPWPTTQLLSEYKYVGQDVSGLALCWMPCACWLHFRVSHNKTRWKRYSHNITYSCIDDAYILQKILIEIHPYIFIFDINIFTHI